MLRDVGIYSMYGRAPLAYILDYQQSDYLQAIITHI